MSITSGKFKGEMGRARFVSPVPPSPKSQGCSVEEICLQSLKNPLTALGVADTGRF